MKKLVANMLLFALFGALYAGTLWAKTEWLTLSGDSTLNGVELAQGDRLKWNGGQEVEILRKGKIITRATVEVQELGEAAANTVLTSSGVIKEIRLKNKKLVFNGSNADSQ